MEKIDKVTERRLNHGYEIIESHILYNTEIVIGYNPNAPEPYVCWNCKNGNDYYNGYYTTKLKHAQNNLRERVERNNQVKQSVKDKLSEAQNAKTEVYLLETDATNEVVFRQGNVAVVFESAPNGMFDNTVDLYRSDEEGLTDINSIKTSLAEYIGNGSDMNSFGEIVNNSLNISTSQTTVMSWEEVDRLVNENNDFKLTFVTEYEDEKMDKSILLKSNMSHNNDARGNQPKQSMKDKLSDAQTKATERNQKREQQEKDKVTPQR